MDRDFNNLLCLIRDISAPVNMFKKAFNDSLVNFSNELKIPDYHIAIESNIIISQAICQEGCQPCCRLTFGAAPLKKEEDPSWSPNSLRYHKFCFHLGGGTQAKKKLIKYKSTI